MREGDFGVRLPHDWTGIDGKIADAFNEIAVVHEKLADADRAGVVSRSAPKASSAGA